MFEDSKTDLFVPRVDNGTALRSALTAGMGGFYLTGANNAPFIGATLTAGAEFEYCLRDTRGALRKSPAFTPEQVFNATYMITTARTEQISYLGYNGTSGSLDVTNSKYFGLKIILNHTFGMLNNSPLIITVPYKTDATATQYELANGLATAARQALARHGACISVTVVNSGAQANALAAATVSVVNGGKQIVTSDDETALIPNGTLLRFGTSGAGTAAVYKVVSQDAGAGAARIYTLDRPYEGATAAAYAAATFESVTEGNYGLRFLGVSVADAVFNPVTDNPSVVSFELEVGDFTTAVATYTTAPFLGRGTYQQIAYLEAYTQFQDKGKEVSAYPNTIRNIESQAAETFAVFSFDIIKQGYIDAVTGQRPISKHRIMIAMLTALVAAEGAEYLVDLGASLGCGAIITGNPA